MYQVVGQVIAIGGGLYEAEFVVTRSGQYDLQVRHGEGDSSTYYGHTYYGYTCYSYTCYAYTCYAYTCYGMARLAMATLTR